MKVSLNTQKKKKKKNGRKATNFGLHDGKLICIVLISLSSVNPPPNFSFPERRIFLSKKRTSIEIGRTSKRNASFEAAKCNAWFDSPVMSRKHALITFDGEKQVSFYQQEY